MESHFLSNGAQQRMLYYDILPSSLNRSVCDKMKTNGEASETHTGGLVSCCLQPLWEGQAASSILRTASPSGQELSESAGRRSWCSLIIFKAPQGFPDIAESVRG